MRVILHLKSTLTRQHLLTTWRTTKIVCYRLQRRSWTPSFSHKKTALSMHFVPHCSKLLRIILRLCQILYDEVVEVFPDSGVRAVGGIIFLRYLCPTILSPPASIIPAGKHYLLRFPHHLRQNQPDGSSFIAFDHQDHAKYCKSSSLRERTVHVGF